MKSFASDNWATAAPEILAAISAANHGHAPAYGADEYTQKAMQLIKEQFDRLAEVIFVYNGTAANTLCLKVAADSYQSILAARDAHIVTSEVGAPCAATGAKLVTLEHTQGKINPADIAKAIAKETYWGTHSNLPRVLSLTQATEMGTVYTIDELAEISKICKKHNLLLHMDGCRLYNAAVFLNKSLNDITQYVDLLSLGGSKNGLLFGEAVVVFNPDLFERASYLHKQLLQLQSKMRFLSAQFIPFFEAKLWCDYASHANKMAQKLATGFAKHKSLKLVYPVQTNQIFVSMPKEMILTLQKEYPFHEFDKENNLARLVTSHDTTVEEVDGFLGLVEQCSQG